MYTIPKNTLKSVLRHQFASLVGRTCKRIEVIRDRVFKNETRIGNEITTIISDDSMKNETRSVLINDLIQDIINREREKFTLVRDLIRELDYETMRQVEKQIEAFSQGINFKVTLQKPDSTKE